MSATCAATIDADGFEMCYETTGSGEPLLLLHGALSTIDTSFGRLRPALALERQVIAVEQQGHGHTPDRDRPLAYRQMADVTASLLRALSIEDVDVIGFSVGAGIAVELAIRYRHLVRSLILASPAISRDGFYPGVLDQDDTGSVNALADSIFHRAYLSSAPRPADWAKLIAKCNQLDRTFEGWNISIACSGVTMSPSPTMISVGFSIAPTSSRGQLSWPEPGG